MSRQRRNPVAEDDSARSDLMSLLAGFLAGDPQQSLEFYNRCLRYCARVANPLIVRFRLRRLIDAEDVANDVYCEIESMAQRGELDATVAADIPHLLRKEANKVVRRERRRNGAVKRGGRGREERSRAAGQARSTKERRVPIQPVQFVDVEEVANEIPDRSPSPEELAVAEDEVERISHMMSDPKWPEIARLCREGYTEAEIARTTGRSVRSVKRRLGSARALWADPAGGCGAPNPLPGAKAPAVCPASRNARS